MSRLSFGGTSNISRLLIAFGSQIVAQVTDCSVDAETL
jgi:hypothetical protein